MEKVTIPPIILWKSNSPEESAAGVALEIDTNLDNTRKQEFLWETPWLLSQAGPHLAMVWAWTCLDAGNVPGDLAGGRNFICMQGLCGCFRLLGVVTS